MTDHLSSPGTGSNTELREFLRSRRARTTPEQAGLPPLPGSRRVPGLRREEVAQLAGVSVDYYVRLERGRGLNVSESVLNAVARALVLDETERGHLFAMARSGRAGGPVPSPQQVRPGLLRVLSALPDVPALVVGHRLDVLAANDLAKALYTDFDALPQRERNMARFVFLDETARELYVDWEPAARSVVGGLHLHAGRHPDDPRLAELVADLSLRDADFRRWWAEHDVDRRTHGTKRYRHPLVGDLTLEYEALNPTAERGQTLGLHTAEPGSPSERALRLLAGRAGGPAVRGRFTGPVPTGAGPIPQLPVKPPATAVRARSHRSATSP